MKCQHHRYLWIDCTTLFVCKNQRIQRHKSFYGYTSQELKSKLLKEQCVDLITHHRKNMIR